MDELLGKVKIALRTTAEDESLNEEINGLILAARADLKVNGVVSDSFATTQRDLVEQAIKLYVKANWGYDNPDAERQLATYELLKTNLSIHSQYGGE